MELVPAGKMAQRGSYSHAGDERKATLLVVKSDNIRGMKRNKEPEDMGRVRGGNSETD